MAACRRAARRARRRRRQQPAAEGDADGEGQEDRHEGGDVLTEGDHVGVPRSVWLRAERASHALSWGVHVGLVVGDGVAQSWPTGVTEIAASRATSPASQDQGHVHRAGPGGVERADGTGVDQPGADLEPGGEAARLAGPLAAEEVLEAGVQADADDQGRVVVVGEQERDVLGGGRGVDQERGDPERPRGRPARPGSSRRAPAARRRRRPAARRRTAPSRARRR